MDGKRDRRPAIPVSRVRIVPHRVSAVPRRYPESTFFQGLVFRCVLAALLFVALCLVWWLDASSGYETRAWLKDTVTQELTESKVWQQLTEWNQQIGEGAKDILAWLRSLFAGDGKGSGVS